MTALKFKYKNEKGVMHFVEFEGKLVGLSVLESQKVAYIQKHNNLDVTFDLKSKEFHLVKVTISTDEDYLTRVYNHMLEMENTYFKDGLQGLCVLVFEK